MPTTMAPMNVRSSSATITITISRVRMRGGIRLNPIR